MYTLSMELVGERMEPLCKIKNQHDLIKICPQNASTTSVQTSELIHLEVDEANEAWEVHDNG